ncbi:MAG: hypothetical protein ABSC55_12980 [Syntrophorhabdales bacterium]
MIHAIETKGGWSVATDRSVAFLAMLVLARWSSSLLRASWGLFNSATAKQARRYEIRAYLFG